MPTLKFCFYQILTAFNKLKIMSKVAHGNWKRLKLFTCFIFVRGDSSLECFDWQLITMGCGSQFQSYIVSSHFSIKMLFGSSLSPVVCMSAYVLSVLFVLLCIVVSYMTCLYELHGKCVIRDRNCLPFVVHPGFTSSYLRGPCCSPESDYFFFLHQNQNIFFSNIRNQNIFLEKNHNPPFKLNGRSLTLVLSEKNFLNETKNHNPPSS